MMPASGDLSRCAPQLSHSQRNPEFLAPLLANWNCHYAMILKEAVSHRGRQQDIASLAGISRAALNGVLNGQRKPRLRTLRAIYEALGGEPPRLTFERRRLTSNATQIPQSSRPGDKRPLATKVLGPRRRVHLFDLLAPHDVTAHWKSEQDVWEYWEALKGPDYFRRLILADATPDDIKERLWQEGTSLADLARTHGVDRRELGRAIAPVDDDRLRQIIADAVGLQLHEIWPSLYRGDNSRRHRPAAPRTTGRTAA